MGLSEKARSVVQTVEGKAKEAIGGAAEDESLRAEGRADQEVGHAVRHDELFTDDKADDKADDEADAQAATDDARGPDRSATE